MICFVGNKLVELGYVYLEYVDVMFECEKLVLIYFGEFIVVLYGIVDVKDCVIKTGIVIC